MVDKVLVAGATGGVGQLVVAQLLEKGWAVRVLARNLDKVKQMFGDRVETALADIQKPETLGAAMPEITHIICATGTTAFPSTRWGFDLPKQVSPWERVQTWAKIYLDADYRNAKATNNPYQVDAVGVENLIKAAPQGLQRFVFVSSCGVERKDQFPYSILNAFGVLDAKQAGETAIKASGFPYTIVRPGRLIDGPYTSYDLNTLLKATTQGKQGVVLATGDTLNGQTSRIDVATACVESLNYPETERKVLEIINQGPRPAAIDWAHLFAHLT